MQSHLNTEPRTPEVYAPRVSVTKAFWVLLATAGHLRKCIARRNLVSNNNNNKWMTQSEEEEAHLHSALMAAVLTGR